MMRNFARSFLEAGRKFLQAGIIKGDYKIYDVNSMYPSVMRDFEHPASATYKQTSG